MNRELLIALTNNAAMLLALSIVCEINYQLPKRLKVYTPYITGLLISAICVVIMSIPFVMAPGLVFDTRSILISISALFFGPIPTAMVVVTAAVYRLIEGGVGLATGLSVIVSSALIGLFWRYRMLRQDRKHRWICLYLMSILVHVVMILCMLLMPWPYGLEVALEIALPVLLVYPLASMLLSLLLDSQRNRNDAVFRQLEAEARYHILFNNHHTIMMLIDPQDGRIVDTNPAAEHFYGWSRPELLSMRIMDISTMTEATVKAEMAQAVQSQKYQAVFRHRRKDGSIRDIEIFTGPIRSNRQQLLFSIFHDITPRLQAEREMMKMEAQLRQKQKMDAIGLLAGGVAHEINNPINGIMNYAQLVLEDTAADSAAASYLNGIIHETKRVSEIVRNLLQFSRQDKQRHSYARIEDIIEQTVSLVRTLLRKDQIDLQLDLPEKLPSIKCRSQQIQQVLLNLLTNARDALNQKYTGYDEDKIIRVQVEAFHADSRRWLRLTVEDHGTGIPEQHLARLFEPFFSTKPKELGTGLGLSISFGIVSDHHGRIEVDSKPTAYTRFHVILPVDNGWSTSAVKED